MSEKSVGRRLFLFTMSLEALSGAALAVSIHSIRQLTTGFDAVYFLLLLASGYVAVIGVYSITTIFYNLDKLSGRQKRHLRFLELSHLGEKDWK